jgi:hypothetical protein
MNLKLKDAIFLALNVKRELQISFKIFEFDILVIQYNFNKLNFQIIYFK